MEGLNKMCLSINLRHEYPSMHGRIQSQPVGPGPSSRHRISNQRGITHINNGIRTNGHTFDPLFSPLTSAKTPVFTKNCLPNPLFFPHCPKFWKFFHSKTPNSSKSAGIWEKGTQMPPIFMAFVTERPPFFLPCMHMFEKNVAPSNTVCRSWKILYSWNRIVQFGEYF